MATNSDSLEILHEDAYLIVVNKPAGLLTQGRAGGEPTLEDLVRSHLSPADPQRIFLGTVHRLDRPVSGVVVWARTERAARRLSAQFAERTTRKIYWAILEAQDPEIGPPRDGFWEDWLGPINAQGVAEILDATARQARRALTEVRTDPLSSQEGVNELRFALLRPETGRTHQLRAQTSSRGWPILGDKTYGSSAIWGGDVRTIALHARSIEFERPGTHQRVSCLAEPPLAWTPWFKEIQTFATEEHGARGSGGREFGTGSGTSRTSPRS